MPKIVPCPVCRSKVKVPADAEDGAVLTCPDCDERFTPPHLRPKGPSLDDEDAYEVRESRDEDDFESAERKEKRRKAKAIQTAGRQHAQGYNRKLKPTMFGAFDIILLAIAAAAALGGVVGLALAKKAPSAGMAAVIIITFCVVMFVFAYRKILMRK
jgi:hypothetical protein